MCKSINMLTVWLCSLQVASSYTLPGGPYHHPRFSGHSQIQQLLVADDKLSGLGGRGKNQNIPDKLNIGFLGPFFKIIVLLLSPF